MTSVPAKRPRLEDSQEETLVVTPEHRRSMDAITGDIIDLVYLRLSRLAFEAFAMRMRQHEAELERLAAQQEVHAAKTRELREKRKAAEKGFEDMQVDFTMLGRDLGN